MSKVVFTKSSMAELRLLGFSPYLRQAGFNSASWLRTHSHDLRANADLWIEPWNTDKRDEHNGWFRVLWQDYIRVNSPTYGSSHLVEFYPTQREAIDRIIELLEYRV